MNNNALELLSSYLRLDTSNPPGNEGLAAEFLAGILKSRGIPFKTYEPAPGRVSIRAEIKGEGRKKPVILLHHMDVVPANKTEWSFDPFGGEVIDGYICGRGALDTKSLGILQLLAFLDIKEKGSRLSRDLVLLAVADEESHSDWGVQWLLREHPEDFAAEVVLNEGSYIQSGIVPGKLVAMISPGEKGPCWLRLERKGRTGHGSTPHGQNALEHMTRAVNRLLKYRPPLTVTPIAAEFIKRMTSALSGSNDPLKSDITNSAFLKLAGQTGLMDLPQTYALLHNTISLNMLKSGDRINVIPSSAEALIDTRLLPGQDPDKWLGLIKRKLADPEIQIDIISRGQGNASPMDTASYKIIESTLQHHYPQSIAAPYLMLGTTDSCFFREKGILAYGFCPTVVPFDHLASIHGIDEKIAVESLLRGVDVYTDVVRRLCT